MRRFQREASASGPRGKPRWGEMSQGAPGGATSQGGGAPPSLTHSAAPQPSPHLRRRGLPHSQDGATASRPRTSIAVLAAKPLVALATDDAKVLRQVRTTLRVRYDVVHLGAALGQPSPIVETGGAERTVRQPILLGAVQSSRSRALPPRCPCAARSHPPPYNSTPGVLRLPPPGPLEAGGHTYATGTDCAMPPRGLSSGPGAWACLPRFHPAR